MNFYPDAEQLEEKREEWLDAFGRVYDFVPLSRYDETTKLAQYAWDEMFAIIAAQRKAIATLSAESSPACPADPKEQT